ncbi:MAG: glyoxalase [Bacteroidetes bacterium]|nr:glyoxalase [Bacteroidota bacterium]
MSFYKKCLGGKLSFQAIAESPLSGKMPAKMKDAILHSTLSKDGFVLMASDLSDTALSHGNSVSLMLSCDSEKELKSCYKKLSEGGSPDHPPGRSSRNGWIGNLRDKYGNQWLLHYSR